MTPEGKVKAWAVNQYDRYFPGHWRISPRGGPFGKSGTGDHILCWCGVFIMIEIKALDGVVSALQMNQLKRVIAAGGVAAVLMGKDYHKLAMIQQAAIKKMRQETIDKLNGTPPPPPPMIVIDEAEHVVQGL